MSGAMRQLEERQLPAEVTIMKWSPKMDLLAVANIKGEVALHRLTWQRVWLLSPLNESDTSVNLAWRPNGKLLAVCYVSSNIFCLVDIENKNIIYKVQLSTQNNIITSITWLPLMNADCDNFAANKSNLLPNGNYLPSLPSLNRNFGQESERKELLSQSLDVLFLGKDNGTVVMYVFGMFYCGNIVVGNGQIIEISGGSGRPIWITWRDNNGIVVNRYSCSLLEKSSAFLKVAQAQANIECLMDYLSRTLMAISEAWETILSEMDDKLARYAESNPPGAVAADFLELLMIGLPTQNLENFLLRDLTEKGLKKLGHSIEMCYSNIQKLVVKNLNSVGMVLVYQLAEIRGMVRLGGPYESLGLKNETLVTKALHASEAFLAKASEMQQVIDHSMRDYKAFFRWLYVEIQRLTDERIPSEVSRMSQQELIFIAEFLKGFDKIESSTGSRKGVNLEKLGQYLRHEPLQTCLKPEGSEWATMLNENHCLRDHSLIMKQDLNFSLLQSHEKLVNAVRDVFSVAYEDLVDHFAVLKLPLMTSASVLSSQIVMNDGNFLIASTDVERKFLRLFQVEPLLTNTSSVSLYLKSIIVDVDNKQGSFTKNSTVDNAIADLQFYSQDYLSLLLLNKQNYASSLLQLSTSHVKLLDHQSHSSLCLADVMGAIWPRPFQGISARRLAVSGARKVAAVLNENNRKIRLLETEVEPEDEDDEDDDGIDDGMMDTTPSMNTSTK